MKLVKVFALLFFVTVLVLPAVITGAAESQSATEALTFDMNAVDDLFNNFGARGTPIDECVAEPEPPQEQGQGRFEDNRFIFEERETVDDGLGPTYNDVGCVECHQSPTTGGFGQQMEFRAGHLSGSNFVDSPGGQLIHARATFSRIQEHPSTAENIRTFRIVINTFGDGFVEAIANGTLTNNVNAQPAAQRGTLINVPVVEANNTLRIGRFGWKAQHASLVSFSGDAYLNEMGITNPFDGNGGNQENPASTPGGVVPLTGVAPFDPVPEPEDDGLDVFAFADFMRATRAPGRGPINAAVNRGDPLFTQIGCAVCHTRTFVTAAPGTLINGGAFTVPTALGNKIIHPFSDFALHNVGTGDGIVQNGGQGTANQMRTNALWGIRGRNRLMHDGLTVTVFEAIQRHAGQATAARNAFNALSAGSRSDVIAFVLSL